MLLGIKCTQTCWGAISVQTQQMHVALTWWCWSETVNDGLVRIGVWWAGTLKSVTASSSSFMMQVPVLVPHWLNCMAWTLLLRYYPSFSNSLLTILLEPFFLMPMSVIKTFLLSSISPHVFLLDPPWSTDSATYHTISDSQNKLLVWVGVTRKSRQAGV